MCGGGLNNVVLGPFMHLIVCPDSDYAFSQKVLLVFMPIGGKFLLFAVFL